MEVQFTPINFFAALKYRNQSQSFIGKESQDQESQSECGSAHQDSTKSEDQSIFEKDSSDSTQIQKDYLVSGAGKKSGLHNFQKHEITFLQNIIKAINFGEFGQVQSCLKKMLSIFIAEKKKTKDSLIPFLGYFNQKSIQKSKYNQLLKEFGRQIYCETQNQFRDQICKKMTDDQILSYVQKSKITKKTQFIEYLRGFKEQIILNEVGLRITKRTQRYLKDAYEINSFFF